MAGLGLLSMRPEVGCFLMSWVAPVLKNLPANAGNIRDPGSIPGSGRSLGGVNGNPLYQERLIFTKPKKMPLDPFSTQGKGFINSVVIGHKKRFRAPQTYHAPKSPGNFVKMQILVQ